MGGRVSKPAGEIDMFLILGFLYSDFVWTPANVAQNVYAAKSENLRVSVLPKLLSRDSVER